MLAGHYLKKIKSWCRSLPLKLIVFSIVSARKVVIIENERIIIGPKLIPFRLSNKEQFHYCHNISKISMRKTVSDSSGHAGLTLNSPPELRRIKIKVCNSN